MGLINELLARGHRITIIDPQKNFYPMGGNGWFAGQDLLVERGRSWALLALLDWAERAGVTTINSRQAISAVHNKALMSIALASSGLPVPQTYLGSIEVLSRSIDAGDYPIILKPIFGDNSRGLLVVNTPEEMAATDWAEPVALAQRYFRTDGFDLKLYGIGDRIWAVRKQSPFNRLVEGGEKREGLAGLTPELEDLGRRCGDLFGLELFGVDCIETEQGVMIIEINDYPNYTNVPDANAHLADFIERRAAEVAKGQ